MKPKIAIIHQAVGIVSGGSETFITELSSRLTDYFDVTLFCGQPITPIGQKIFVYDRNRLKNTRNPLIKTLYNRLAAKADFPEIALEYISSMPGLFIKLMLENYDVLYPSNNWGGLAVCKWVRRLKGTPIFYKEMDGQNVKNYTRNISFKPDKYIATTQTFKSIVKKDFPHVNVDYIPCGVNLSQFRETDKRKRPERFTGPVVLAVGEFIDRKQLDLTVKAVAALKDVNLLIVSFGAEIDQLQALGNRLLGPERFELVRNVNFADMPLYYAACDVFTLPSVNESFGLVYIEAMACNKPVVAPNDQSRMEIVGNAGLFCDVTNIQEYADTLQMALNTDWQDLPLKQVNKYDWDTVTPQFAAAIQSLL